MATITGGDKLKAKLAELSKLVSKTAKLRVGFLENAKYPGGTPVAMVAAIQNYGAPAARIPPRPFFSNMVKDKSPEWPKAIAALLKANDYDAERALDIAGDAIEGQLRDSIANTFAPPLSPTTLMLRKMFGNHPELIRGRDVWEARRRVAAGKSYAGVSTKPLVWTGHLINSVGHDVRT